MLGCLFDIVPLLTPFLLVWYKAIEICSVIIWVSERRLKPLKPISSPVSLWYHFHWLCFAEFSLHLEKITETGKVKQW